MKLDRLFAITMLILNRKRISAEELAGYFEVSVRTIYRDIDTINQAGIPITAYPGKNGGFGILDNYKIDKNILTPDELFSIITALKSVSRTFNDRKISDTVEKLQTLMPKNKAEDLEKKKDVVLDFTPWGENKSQKEKFSIIRKAIENSNILEFDYLDSQGISSKRKIEPMILHLKSNSWYLAAYCLLRKDFRFFRLSRMKSLTISAETFMRREYDKEITDPKSWGKRPWIAITMLFKPHAKVRVEDFFEPEQIKYQPDGLIKINISFPEDEWIYGFILSFGDDVEVLSPLRLRKFIRNKCKNMLNIYSDHSTGV